MKATSNAFFPEITSHELFFNQDSNPLFVHGKDVKTKSLVHYKKVQPVDRAKKEKEAVFHFISTQYMEKELNLKMIQRHTGISEYKIAAIIKQACNLHFKQYLNNIRIHEVKRLLKESNLQISEIAYLTGYGHISHFNRVFSAYVGMSPLDFRKN